MAQVGLQKRHAKRRAARAGARAAVSGWRAGTHARHVCAMRLRAGGWRGGRGVEIGG